MKEQLLALKIVLRIIAHAEYVRAIRDGKADAEAIEVAMDCVKRFLAATHEIGL